jgi:LysM repeat protein
MRAQGVSRGSTLSTTVTYGGKEAQSEPQTTYLKTNSQARQKWLAKKANIVIKHAVAYYEVKKGDTLSKIAQRYGTTIKRVMRINKLKSTTILVGQLIKV